MYKVTTGAHTYTIELDGDQAKIDGEKVHLDLTTLGNRQYHLLLGKRSYNIEIVSYEATSGQAVIKVNNKAISLEVSTELDELLKKMGLDKQVTAISQDIEAPMPGLILDINVSEGQEVQKGDKLLILEAMKMENVIKSPGNGKVKKVMVKQGESVELGQKLVLFE